ncbi:MAG TPA: hypothetical protein VK169_12425 [Saprospiraceae bacterium]|nr:hypothetical protein [Saprospiraceae bacterium]
MMYGNVLVFHHNLLNLVLNGILHQVRNMVELDSKGRQILYKLMLGQVMDGSLRILNSVKMDMLKVVKKFIIITVLLNLIGCNSSFENESNIKLKYNHSSFEFYKQIHKNINDTLIDWKNDSLSLTTHYFAKNNNEWQIDSLLLINKDSTRLFGYMLKSMVGWRDAKVDYLEDLAGAKINEKWYFFFGSSTIIDRASYQDSIYSPMTFDELSYLARENMSGAFYQDETGEVKVRESFFDFMDDPNGWGLPAGSTRKDIDSVIVARNKEMRQYKIDPAEIEQIKAEMAKSVRPKEPIPDLKWYEKIFPKEKKLFETHEWKEYVKSKNQK